MLKFLCKSKYIVLPVSHLAQNKRLKFFIHEKLVFNLDIAIDYLTPDFNAYINVERFNGQELTLSVIPEMRLELEESDVRYENEEIYHERYRPSFHFSAKRGWLNDPNGLVYANGIYHMFYQHNPVACKWNNMHWGHAMSSDLLHWQETDEAICPDDLGMAFSGSAVVDENNVSGLKSGTYAPILLFYTAAGGACECSSGHHFTQCMAYSTDNGMTFAKYQGKPLIECVAGGNRDPKVIYHEESGRYILALYLDQHRFALFASRNLLSWDKFQEITLPEDAECPDFYPLPLDGDQNNVKWVFSAAGDHYLVGSFDGYQFKPETDEMRLHHGQNSYASQTFSGMPGRRLRISWNTFDIPSMPFNCSMTFPQEISLKTIRGTAHLCAMPAKEIENLYEHTECEKDIPVCRTFSRKLDGRGFDIRLKLLNIAGKSVRLSFLGMEVICDARLQQITCQKSTSPLDLVGGALTLRILADTTGIELYVNDGRAFLSIGGILDYNLSRFEILSDDTSIMIGELTVSALKNIWQKA